MGAELLVSCLCVTHNRPEFMPWVLHQFEKQGAGQFAELVIVDSSERYVALERAQVRHQASEHPGIAEKRTEALKAARAPFVTWFDDDDWQHPGKLYQLKHLVESGYDAAGTRHAYMYSVQSGLARLYQSTYEPIIFNSAIYRKDRIPQQFDPSKITGEDTEWHERWLLHRPNFVTLAEPMHAWLCHLKNVTNRSSSSFFEMRNPVPFDDWELDFIERLKRGALP